MQRYRAMAGLLAGLTLSGTVVGCGGGGDRSVENLPPGPASQSQPQQPKPGMSTRNKVLLLAGAAALYYLWKKNANKPETARGPQGKYYRSKNGRIYFRDAQGKAHWVTPPQQPIEVAPDEYQRYFGRQADPSGRVIREAPQTVL